MTKRGRQPLLPLLLLLLLLLHRRTLGQLGTAARQGSSLLARVPALHNRNKHNYTDRTGVCLALEQLSSATGRPALRAAYLVGV